MGLDMYLKVKRNRLEEEKEKRELTGVCNGLFPFSPSNPENMEEIGYWRKAYEIDNSIMAYFDYTPDDNCVDFELDEKTIRALLNEAKEYLKRNYFNEYDYQDWKRSIPIFEKALEEIKAGNTCLLL